MSENDSSNERTVDRRRILKGVGATAAAAAAGSATASASHSSDARPDPERIDAFEREYGSFDDVRTAIVETDDGLIETLSEQGYIDSADVDALDVERFDERTPSDSLLESASVLPHLADSGWTADVTTRIESEDQVLDLHFLPEEGRSYALVSSKGSEGRFAIESDGTVRQLSSSMNCWTYCYGGCSWATNMVTRTCCYQSGDSGSCYTEHLGCATCF